MSMYSVCLRKKRHRSKACAEKGLDAQLRDRPPMLAITDLIVYKCPYCPGWHIGHRLPEIVVAGSVVGSSHATGDKTMTRAGRMLDSAMAKAEGR